MSARSSSRSSRQGFTYIEVIAALVVLGIMALCISAGLYPHHYSVAVEADILRSHIGYAQSLAMANNTAEWRMAFAGKSYALERNEGAGWGASPVPWPGGDAATYALPPGVSIVSGLGLVEIDEWGAPFTTHNLTLSDGTEQHQISITGFTGWVP